VLNQQGTTQLAASKQRSENNETYCGLEKVLTRGHSVYSVKTLNTESMTQSEAQLLHHSMKMFHFDSTILQREKKVVKNQTAHSQYWWRLRIPDITTTVSNITDTSFSSHRTSKWWVPCHSPQSVRQTVAWRAAKATVL
jgi:hypothetical protein